MKKVQMLILSLIVALSGISIMSASAWVGDRYENEEIAFYSIMTEMKEEQDIEYDTYTFTKSVLNKLSGEISGYVYDFTLDSTTDGFILMTKVVEYFEVTEIFLDAKSPFWGNNGINIYPTFCRYYSFENEIYTDLSTGVEVSAESVIAAEEFGFGFGAAGSITSWTEQVNYTTRNVTSNQLSLLFPAQTFGYGSNDCAVIAGKNIVSYWDYFKPNLIPNYEPYTLTMGLVMWKNDYSEISYVGTQLYNRMGTNKGGAGTTIPQFKNGMNSYASAYGGYSVTYRSTMTGSNYDMNKMLTEFAANRPVALFMSPEFNFAEISSFSDVDLISTTAFINDAHSMVAYGRQIYTYFNASGNQIRQITYLRVAGCMSGAGKGWLRLNEGYLHIDDCFSVEIN